jgi:predicted dehydrogenase
MNVAVIGAGHLGAIHTKLWKTHPQIQSVTIVEPNQERGAFIANEYGVGWVQSLDDIRDGMIQAVTICSPTSTHYHIARTCLARGFHCFIEKPLTATYEEAALLCDVAEQQQCVVQVGHVERFNPAIQALRARNVEPLFIEAHRLASFKPRAIDVSVVHDLMIHDIDLLLWLTGSHVTDIQATGVAVLTDTADICNARITFASGCVANVTASRISAKPLRKLRLFQKQSYTSVDFNIPSLEMYHLVNMANLEPSHQTPLGTISTQYGEKVIVFDTPPIVPANAIMEEQASFIRSIQQGIPSAVQAREGAEAVRIAELIHQMI